MSEQRHVIKRQTIEVQVGKSEQAQRLYSELSRVCHQQIVPLIDRCCSELSTPDQIHRIDSLEINLGIIDPRHLETDIVAKLRPALHMALAKEIDQQEQAAGRRGYDHKAASQLELLAFFARTGSLPWWADAAQPRLLEDCLHYVTRAAPDPLRRLMGELSREQQPLKRIVHHYDGDMLAVLFRSIVPHLEIYPQAVVTLLREGDIAAHKTQMQLFNAVWLGMLRTASVQNRQRAAPLSFCRDALLQIAHELGISFAALVFGIQKKKVRTADQLGQLAKTLFEELPTLEKLDQVLKGLQREKGSLSALAGALLSVRLPDVVQAQLLAALSSEIIQIEQQAVEQQILPRQWLADLEETSPLARMLKGLQRENGSLSALAGALLSVRLPDVVQAQLLTALSSPAAEDEIIQIVQQAVEQQILPRQWLADLRNWFPEETSPPARLDQLEEEQPAPVETLGAVLQRLQRENGPLSVLAGVLQPLAGHLPGMLQSQLLVALGTLASEDEMIRQVNWAVQQAIGYDILPVSIARQWLAGLQAAKPVPAALVPLINTLQKATREDISETPIDLRFSDADELYIDNAGLVILWPFVGHFFTRLGLLEEKQFINLAARQRAVALLHYLVTGERTCPEYRLALNKVLCGIAPDVLFDLDPPLSEAEAEEGENLLQAVIAQAPILHDMSVSGLRGTFLLRQGVLGTRDGAWLLRVERETYDVVLDRFPWGWAWVKLPWMNAPLRVEW